MERPIKEGGKVLILKETHTARWNEMYPAGYLLKELDPSNYGAFTPDHVPTNLSIVSEMYIEKEMKTEPYTPAPGSTGHVYHVSLFADNACRAKVEFSDKTTVEIELPREVMTGLSIEQRFAALMSRAHKMLECDNNASNGV